MSDNNLDPVTHFRMVAVSLEENAANLLSRRARPVGFNYQENIVHTEVYSDLTPNEILEIRRHNALIRQQNAEACSGFMLQQGLKNE